MVDDTHRGEKLFSGMGHRALAVSLVLFVGLGPSSGCKSGRSGTSPEVPAGSSPSPQATADAPEVVPAEPSVPGPPPLKTLVDPSWPYEPDANPHVHPSGMVASDDELATKVGADVLGAGGNAIDAAVATALAMAVTYPQAGNLGGGGFAVVRVKTPDGFTERALDFRETAPGKATRDMYLGPDGKPVRELSITGHLASGVPGSVAGLWELHRELGALPWTDVVSPAIELASKGFPIGENLASRLASSADKLAKFPASKKLYVPGGKPLGEGDTLRNPALAGLLRTLARSGPAPFYKGKYARLLVREMKRGNGLITMADLAAYQAKWREPVSFSYRGHRVVSMPLPSSGGLVMAFMARLVSPHDLRALGWGTPRTIHVVAEAMRRGFALRNELLGDSDLVQVDPAVFLSPRGLDRVPPIDPAQATPSIDVDVRRGTDQEGDHTTHLSVVDAQGQAVALTTTLNTSFGSGVTVPGAGYLMNNEMDDFAVAPGTPNVFGLVQGEANAIAPGKRMLSSMTPTLVFDPAGELLLVTGASGGPTILTAVFQIVMNIVDHQQDLVMAMILPRFHHQHLPDAIIVENDGFAASTLEALAQMGHETMARGWNIGDAPSIVRVESEDYWLGFGEPRRPGSAALGPGSAETR